MRPSEVGGFHLAETGVSICNRTSLGVVREDFLKNHLDSELDPLWLETVSKLTAKGWKNFVARDKDRIKAIQAGSR
jgi:hypothetical protein